MFSQNLRRLRTQKRLTQKEIAAALGISRVAYTNYELGKRRPNLETAAHIARILGAPVEQLLDMEPGDRLPGAAANVRRAEGAREEAPLPLLLTQAQSLSPQSLRELRAYIELLRIRDEAAKGGRSRSGKRSLQ